MNTTANTITSINATVVYTLPEAVNLGYVVAQPDGYYNKNTGQIIEGANTHTRITVRPTTGDIIEVNH